jgi:hypothetical protein
MSAEAVDALNHRADRLSEEASNQEAAGNTGDVTEPGTHPHLLRWLAGEFRELAFHMQGGRHEAGENPERGAPAVAPAPLPAAPEPTGPNPVIASTEPPKQ